MMALVDKRWGNTDLTRPNTCCCEQEAKVHAQSCHPLSTKLAAAWYQNNSHDLFDTRQLPNRSKGDGWIVEVDTGLLFL